AEGSREGGVVCRRVIAAHHVRVPALRSGAVLHDHAVCGRGGGGDVEAFEGVHLERASAEIEQHAAALVAAEHDVGEAKHRSSAADDVHAIADFDVREVDDRQRV